MMPSALAAAARATRDNKGGVATAPSSGPWMAAGPSVEVQPSNHRSGAASVAAAVMALVMAAVLLGLMTITGTGSDHAFAGV